VTRGLQAPRGTSDVLPGDAHRRLRLQRLVAEVLGRAGYEPFDTDIVQKEMFTFEDKAGRSLTLRPEGTAGVCRAYVEHGMHKLAQPVKLWYWGPYFATRRRRPVASASSPSSAPRRSAPTTPASTPS
jgi:histidyl-tRNA synthetase